MKALLQLVAIILIAFVLELLLPWWSIAVAAALGGFFLRSNLNFLMGFLAIALLWTGKALLIDMNAAVDLGERVAKILTVSKPVLLVVTALLGGLVGGFASLTGSLLREKKKARYY
jgi:hypothetical protein